MLREGLRSEFPAVFDLAERMRPARVPTMRVPLAMLAALGARGLVGAILTSTAILLLSGRGVPGVNVTTVNVASTIVSTAAGVAVALGAARWRGAVATAGLFGVLGLVQFWETWPGRVLFCERSGGELAVIDRFSCDLMTVALAQLWPLALGVLLGVAAQRTVRSGPPGVAALLVGFGVYEFAFPIVRLIIALTYGPTPVGAAAAELVKWVIGTQLVAAFALGFIAAWFGRRPLVAAIVIALFFILPWVPQLPRFFDQPSSRPLIVLEMDWQFFVPVGYAAAALVGLLTAIAARRRVPEQRATDT